MSDRQNTVVVHGMAGDGPLRIFGDGASIVASVGTAAGKSTASAVGSSVAHRRTVPITRRERPKPRHLCAVTCLRCAWRGLLCASGRGLVLGLVGGGVGAPCVTWVLGEPGVVGDNNLVWVSPWWECDRVNVMRLSSTSAGEHARSGS